MGCLFIVLIFEVFVLLVKLKFKIVNFKVVIDKDFFIFINFFIFLNF